MAKVTVFNFYGDKKSDSGRIQHNTLIDEKELISVTEEAYQNGLDVMIKRLKEKTDEDVVAILYYSTNGFKQR